MLAAAWSSHTIKVSSPEPWVRPVKGGVAGFMTLTPLISTADIVTQAQAWEGGENPAEAYPSGPASGVTGWWSLGVSA
jgi:hypothetical protein